MTSLNKLAINFNYLAKSGIFTRSLSRSYRRIVTPLIKEDVTIEDPRKISDLQDFREVYPDFMPSPDFDYRNRLCERLQRNDMIKRRKHLEIPEFYAGSIVAVTLATDLADTKTTRFLGICLFREDNLIRHSFTLRNVIEGNGVEVMYQMYCPLIKKIELIKLEKRIDNNLFYLRDCYPEYSYFPQDMLPVFLPDGVEVPVNTIKAKLRPRPWSRQYQLDDTIKGVEDKYMSIYKDHKKDMVKQYMGLQYQEHDLMREYRATISEEEQAIIYREVKPHLKRMNAVRRKIHRTQIGDPISPPS